MPSTKLSGNYLLRAAFSLLSFALTLIWAGSLYSQTAGTASIQGTVTDSTGAVIPNGEVSLTSTATQVKRTVTTGDNGLYSFPNLPVGTYNLDVTAPGFRHYVQSNIILEVGSSIAVNATMTIGTTDQKVEVLASGLALQTEDASFKQTIDQQTLTELPLNGRQVTALITLSGASAPAPITDLVGSKSFYSSVAISVAGGQGNSTDYRLDGADHNDYMTNVNLPFPFPDAVGQFSVESTVLGAQDGLHPGGLVNVVTRAGSNQFHGTVFEFIRNNYFNATNFFSTSKDTLHQNQYGATLGGRIIKDKLFFFAGYQHLKAAQNQSLTPAFVPTAANLLGDFSVTDGPACTSSKTNTQLLNPKTGAILVGNKIDPASFNASALALQKYLPATSDPCGRAVFAIPSLVNENQFITRIDSTLTSKHSLYGRYFLDGYETPALFSPTNILLTNLPANSERAQSLTIGETYIATSKLVNSFHVTGSRRRDNRGPADTGINATTIGINNYEPIPVGFQVSVTSKFSTYCGSCALGHFNVNTFSVADDVNYSHGKHQMAFGGEFARTQLNSGNTYEANGVFTFSGTFGQKGPNGSSAGGTGLDANLDFLTGSMSKYEQSIVATTALRTSIPSLYAQDTYHATKNFVLAGGVRWQPGFWPKDYFNRGEIFDMDAFLSNTHSTVYPTAPAGVFFHGEPGVPDAFTQSSPWQFSPRLGLTYDVFGNGKTIARAGTALMYDQPSLYTGIKVNQGPPYNTLLDNLPVGAPLNFSSPFVNGTIIGNPFPVPLIPTAATAVFPNGIQYFFLPKKFHNAYTTQWTASVQQQFGTGWQFQVDYIGNKSTFLPYSYSLNPAIYIPGSSTTGNSASRYAFTRANPTQGPKFGGGGGGTTLITSGANATYNAMIASIQHRASKSFTVMVNYTWSHCIDIVDAQGDFGSTTLENPSNPRLDRGNCGFDFRHTFNSTIVASSHFPLTGWASHLVNNWQVAPLFRITDGVPFNITSGVDNSLTAIGNDRPNLIAPNSAYTNKKLTRTSAGNLNFLNPAAFTQNAAGTYGNLGRNAFRGPNLLQLDVEVSRDIPFRENINFQLRLESFNVLNHPEFSIPSSLSVSSATFGQVTSTLSGTNARLFQLAGKINF